MSPVYSSLQFIGFACLFALAMRGATTVSWRQAIMAAANAVFILVLFGGVFDALILILFLLIGYGLLQVSNRANKKQTTLITVGLLTGVFIYFKQYTFIAFIPKPDFIFQALGISYIFFRIVHLIIDKSDKQILGDIGPIEYFNFTCNFLAFLSGPVTRLEEHRRDMEDPSPAVPGELADGLRRITIGYFKLLVVAGVLDVAFDRFSPQVLGTAPLEQSIILVYGAAAALYTGILYFNFSGSMDVLIGFGKLSGQRLPENFNKPFSSRNMIDFWTRWHMTLSNWFKRYLFTPVLVALLKKYPAPALASALGVLTYFIVFGLMGVWHGTTYIFFVYGLFLGGGVAGNKLYQNMMTKRISRKRYKALGQNPFYAYGARGLTIGYFAVSLSSFWMTISDIPNVFRVLSPFSFVVVIVLLSVLWALCSFVLDALTPKVEALWRQLQKHSSSIAIPGVAHGYPVYAVLIIVTIVSQIMLNKPAEFIYANF